VTQDATKEQPMWANPGALGLAGFGFNTILLQIHNLGLIDSTLPIIFGFFWGGMAQVIAGIIDGKRGDTFGLTAFTSYGFFWLGLSLAFLLQWTGVVTLDKAGLGWLFVMWGVFTFFMTLGTFRMTYIHITIFSTLTILFFLLAAHNFWGLNAKIVGVEGVICGLSAAYGAAAVVLNAKYEKTVCPMGVCKLKK
jgi:succinate-acetate transporter protein